MTREDIIQTRINAYNEKYRMLGVYCYPWLIRIAKRYKELKEVPFDSFLLVSYYKEQRDIETAFIMALSMQYNESNLMENILLAKELLGEHPFECLRNRVFINWHKFYDNYFQQKKVLRYERAMDYAYKMFDCNSWNSLKEIVEVMPYHVNVSLRLLLGSMPIDDSEFRFAKMAIMLTSNEGFGLDVWKNESAKAILAIPNYIGFNKMLSMFYPPLDKHTLGIDQEDAMRFIGFEYVEELVYAYLALGKVEETHKDEYVYFKVKWAQFNLPNKRVKGYRNIKLSSNRISVKISLKRMLPPETW